MNTKRAPKVRFKGFTDAWELRKLGEIMNVTSVKRIHQSDWTDSGVRFLRARDIVSAAKNEEPDDYLYISKEKYEKYSAISGKVAIDDMLVTGVGTIGIPYLVRNLEPLYFKDGNIIWFQNNKKIDGEFFYYSFLGSKIQNFINESAGTGTVGTYTIESGKKTPILLPAKEEQQVLGKYFRNLDHLITLHQRKLDKMKELKKAFLNLIFSQKLRFRDFSDSWELRKLGELAEFNPKAEIPNVFEYVDLESVVGTEMVSHRQELKLTAPSRAQRLAQTGDLFYQTVRPYQKNNYLFEKPDKHYVFSTGYAQIRPYQDGYFLLCLVQNDNFVNTVLDNCIGTSYPAINANDLSNIDVQYPIKTEEQTKIGSFFRSLDRLITLHQKKIDSLKEMKKILLKNMLI
ncbi:restriction endonuclease subunit S [Phascolarctobacterium faecium]|uniref:restriction endonuclease subunit S n=1 Tax=Phascolarctobacterium faecium TaxID=33025 RepID=UPI003AB8986B